MNKTKSYCFLLFASLCFSCSSGSENTNSSSASKIYAGETADAGDVSSDSIAKGSMNKPEGLILIEKSDCTACHADYDKLVGPSYKAIAERYRSVYKTERENLVNTILNGGEGVWGEVPMTAHPQHTRDEIDLMLEYIMTVE